MIAELKKCLSECHLKGGDKTVQFLLEATPMYLITRAKEEMWAVNSENDLGVTERQLKLSIQLLNIARYKLSLAGVCNQVFVEQGDIDRELICTLSKGHKMPHRQE